MTPQDYGSFLHEVKQRIRERHLQVLRSVNRELVELYWEIGELIHQKQQALGWGKSVVETLAQDLQAEFPGRNGFSARNLWNMREFYNSYADRPNLQPLVAEISWTKNLMIFSRCKDDLEREFYLRATARYGWTKAVLQHQVDNKSYEKYLLNQTNFDATVPDDIKAQAALAVKDNYTFDFLELADEHSERELELALVRNLRAFLSELGGAFAFIGNQYRFEVGGQEYFIDLLLFHRRLRCLVAIELKIGDFKPEHKGKMEFIYWHFRTRAFRELITNSANGANPTMKKINKGIVQNLPVALPEISIQQSIVKKLDAFVFETQRLETIYHKKLVALNELKQSILQKAFTGALTTDILTQATKTTKEVMAA
ncbi:PDDEXK nuclease domain-containing protein [Leptothoe spongobia]|nr:PDDEXK nuclease domain-containing protein [Leptothoe spongobia]